MMLFSVKFVYVIFISEINCFQIKKEIKTLLDIFRVFKQLLGDRVIFDMTNPRAILK